MRYNINEGYEILKRVKLMMGYNLKNTLSENTIIIEQEDDYPVGYNQYGSDDWNKFKKAHPELVWDPNITMDQPELQRDGSTYINKIKVGGWVPITPNNVGLRGTPFGFHPDEYKEYVSKLSQLKKNVKDKNQLTKEISKLKSEYYHPDFPYGIKKEDYKKYIENKKILQDKQKQVTASINKKFDPVKANINQKSDYTASVARQQIYKAEQNANIAESEPIRLMSQYLDLMYQYDPFAVIEVNKSEFRKNLESFWNTWGVLAELVAWFIADIITEGAITWLTSVRQQVVLAKILKFAYRVGLPLGIGTYELSENEWNLNSDTIVWYCFAVLPWAHDYFKIPEAPSTQVCESIIKKMKGKNMKDPKSLAQYVKSLTEEEKKLFKKVMSLSQKERITGVKKSIVKINELYVKKFGKSIRPSISKKIINFITRLTIDLTSIEIVKSIASKAGFTIKEDEKKKLAAYIDSIKSNRSELLVSIGNIYQSMVFSKTAQGLLDYGGVNDIIKDAKNKKYFKKDEDVLEELVTNQSLKSVVKDLVPKELQSEFESLLKQIEKEKKEKK